MENMKNTMTRRLFIETISVLLITIILFLLFGELSSIVCAMPAVYLLIERRIRNRTWSSIGFKFRDIFKDIKKVWNWLIVIIFISPILTVVIAERFLPEFIEHVKGRLPMDINSLITVMIVITIGTFLEEVLFRGFIQERLSWFTGGVVAIIIASTLFALIHFSPGKTAIVIFDLTAIFIDSIIYGIIYHKTKNIYVSWIGHFLCDIVAIIIMLMFL